MPYYEDEGVEFFARRGHGRWTHLREGDTVRIRPDITRNTRCNVGLNDVMLEFRGRIAVIRRVEENGTFYIDLDNERFAWESRLMTDTMFESLPTFSPLRQIFGLKVVEV